MGDVAIRLAPRVLVKAAPALTSQPVQELGRGPAPMTGYSPTKVRDEDVRLFRSGGKCRACLYPVGAFASVVCQDLMTFKTLSMPPAIGVPG